MAGTGYSGTALIKKLGIKEDMKLLVIHPPINYFELLEKDISSQYCKKNELPALIHLFATSYASFEKDMWALQPMWKKNTAVTIWVSWYKKSSGMATDITEDNIRHYALANGLVDVKVCAVSDWWSALKLVVPLRLRAGKK